MKCSAKIKSHQEALDEEHDVLIFNHPPTDYPIFKKARAKLKIYYVLALYERSLLKGLNPRVYLPWNKNMLFIKKSLRSSYLKLSNSTWMYHWLKENMNINSELLIGGINAEIFHPVQVEKNPSEIRILCSGDPRERKGTETVLEAVEIAKRGEPRIILDTYYGKGISQEDMAETYSSADIFVDGQWYAGWNNPVAEAMACEVPVVCTDSRGVEDFAFHERTALLVSPKDPEAMASAILRLIRDAKLGETLRGNAFEHIRQFDWDKSAKRFEDIINSELSEKRDLSLKIGIAVHNPGKALNKVSAMLKEGLQKKGGFDKYRKYGAYHWHDYYQTPSSSGLYKTHVDYITDNFKKESKGSLLDAGCGDGLISHLLAQIGFEVKGIDVDAEAIRLARQKSSLADFEMRDILEVNEQFDYLVASEVIEHLTNLDDFLQKISKLFRKEELITTPNKDYYKKPDPYHVKEYSIFEFESLLGKYFQAFQIQRTEYHLYAWIKKN